MIKRNIKLSIAFDGSSYNGWQRQKNARTIQGVLEDCLQKMTRENVTLYGAGRTDAGVHALCMVSHFITSTKIPVSGFVNGLNSMLPTDIRVLNASQEKLDFHSRFQATAKTYRYDFFTGAVQLPIERLYCAHFPGQFDLEKIKLCLQLLIGPQDFSSFEGSGSRDPNIKGGKGSVRNLFQADCRQISNSPEHWSFLFTGDGFLRHMVRNLVGTLIEVGMGKRSLHDFKNIIAAKDRSMAGPTAPARGLFLVLVHYSDVVDMVSLD